MGPPAIRLSALGSQERTNGMADSVTPTAVNHANALPRKRRRTVFGGVISESFMSLSTVYQCRATRIPLKHADL
jgi:hypothetical protein